MWAAGRTCDQWSGLQTNREKKGRWRKEQQIERQTESECSGVQDNLLCRWREGKKERKWEGIMGLMMIHGRSWMHFSDAIPGILECVWMSVRRVGVWARQKKAKIKERWQNIWLPGNRALSSGSIELWRMVVHDSTSQIWFQSRVGRRSSGGRDGGGKDREMSPPVLICQGWGTMNPWALEALSLGAQPWHFNWGPQTGQRLRGLLLVLGCVQVVYTACNLKMSSLHRLITRWWDGLMAERIKAESQVRERREWVEEAPGS